MRWLCLLLVGCGGAVSAVDGGGDALADAGSDSSTDAFTASDVSTSGDGPNAKCFGNAPSVDKSCSSNDCAIGLHMTDCCGSLFAVGINQAQKAAFDAQEMKLESGCPMCDCAPKITQTESGGSCAMPSVKCASGKCQTFCP